MGSTTEVQSSPVPVGEQVPGALFARPTLRSPSTLSARSLASRDLSATFGDVTAPLRIFEVVTELFLSLIFFAA